MVEGEPGTRPACRGTGTVSSGLRDAWSILGHREAHSAEDIAGTEVFRAGIPGTPYASIPPFPASISVARVVGVMGLPHVDRHTRTFPVDHRGA